MDADVQSLLTEEAESLANDYANTPGLLMYLLGNENNYGLFWGGSETQNIPTNDEEAIPIATAMYQTFNAGAVAIKNIDSNHPVALCNGDLQFIDLISQNCDDVDVFGTNMYRGEGFLGAFTDIKSSLDKPVLFTEMGSDAFNSSTYSEDQSMQAYYDIRIWEDVYSNVAGMSGEGNCIGGCTFQFTDGWWKYGQTYDLYVHNYTASWTNTNYTWDYNGGANMNEEWFGICQQNYSDDDGYYTICPRSAYYALKEVHDFNPYEGTTDELTSHFDEIKSMNWSSEPALIAIEEEYYVKNEGEQIELQVLSNLSWTLSHDADWFSVDVTSGSGCEFVTVTVNTNNTGVDRSDVITLTSDDENLEILIYQNELGISPEETPITIVNATAQGTQINDIISVENAYDNDQTTRWSASSYDGSVYIQFEFDCIYELNEVQISFFNGDLRTADFLVAISTDGVNFEDITSVITSGQVAGMQSFELESSPMAQYVRIYGYGNSISSWNSYLEIDFYGDQACDGGLTSVDFNSNIQDFTIYPNPVQDILVLSGATEYNVYSMLGELIFEINGTSENVTVDVSNLESGMYIIRSNMGYSTSFVKD